MSISKIYRFSLTNEILQLIINQILSEDVEDVIQTSKRIQPVSALEETQNRERIGLHCSRSDNPQRHLGVC